MDIIIPNYTKKFNDTNCFDFENSANVHIEIKASVNHCQNGTKTIFTAHYTNPEFGVIFDDYQKIYVDFPDYQKINMDFWEYYNKFNISSVNVNDFLMLKLREQFDNVPFERVKLSTFEYGNKNILYEMVSSVYIKYYERSFFHRYNVTPESQSQDFTCPENFQDLISSICKQKKETCTKQNYICGELFLPNFPYFHYQLHSGDLLIRRQDSLDVEIFGFFTTDFIPKNYTKYSFFRVFSENYYFYSPGNYSYDTNGAIFVGFTEKVLNWINVTKKIQTESKCMEFSKIVTQNKVKPGNKIDLKIIIILISVICPVVLIFFVSTLILWRKYKSKIIWRIKRKYRTMEEVPDLQLAKRNAYPGSSNLDYIEMTGLEEIFAEQNDHFNGAPDWWSEIQLPEGVREIPITDLKGIKRLGAGGFAVVYQAEFKESAKIKYEDLGEQQVALKILFKEFLQVKDQMDAILKEVAAMSKLDNQHIVKLLGASLVIRPSIVMELVPQGSLEDLLETNGYKSCQTSLLWKLKLILNISKGIQYLHYQNIIHRDIKPANILIKDRDTAFTKISDFGLAKIQQTTQSKTRTKHIAGTRQYMAPEMFDKSAIIDKQVDVWALGVVMQQIFRGVRPWEGENENFIICRISVHKEPPESGELPRDCPEDLRLLIKSCWKSANDRPSSEEIVNQLNIIFERETSASNSSDQYSSQSTAYTSELWQV